MSQPNRLTATVAIAQFERADIAAQYPWGLITAASIVITLPLVVLVLLFQRRIISGLTAGGSRAEGGGEVRADLVQNVHRDRDLVR